MKRCRLCKNDVPKHQSFCTICGTRQTYNPKTKLNVLSSLKYFFYKEFSGEAEEHLQAGFELGKYGFEAAISDHERAARLNPKHNSILATTYGGAANERLGLWGGGGVLGRILLYSSNAGEILSLVNKFRTDKENVFGKPPDFLYLAETYSALNKALDGALLLYDKAVQLDPEDPQHYFSRAEALSQLANYILVAYGVFPTHMENYLTVKSERWPIEYGAAKLGISFIKEPNLQFVEEILWLYNVAKRDYEKAIDLNHTDTQCYVQLSHVEHILGNQHAASDYLAKALEVLNKALRADSMDTRSYSERAMVFEELGEIDLAIQDLEHALKLSADQYDISFIKTTITRLREVKGKTETTKSNSKIHEKSKCMYHPEREAADICTNCSNGICTYCRTLVEGKIYCPTCVDAILNK